MNSINYQALRKVAQDYQSTLAWYEAIPDSPNAEVDCDRALAAFKCQIRHREVDIIADLLDELEAAKKRITELELQSTPLAFVLKEKMTQGLRINRKCLASPLHPAGGCNKHFCTG